MKRKKRSAFQSVALYDAEDNRISSVFKYRSKRLLEQAAKNPGSDIRGLLRFMAVMLVVSLLLIALAMAEQWGAR